VFSSYYAMVELYALPHVVFRWPSCLFISTQIWSAGILRTRVIMNLLEIHDIPRITPNVSSWEAGPPQHFVRALPSLCISIQVYKITCTISVSNWVEKYHWMAEDMIEAFLLESRGKFFIWFRHWTKNPTARYVRSELLSIINNKHDR